MALLRIVAALNAADVAKRLKFGLGSPDGSSAYGGISRMLAPPNPENEEERLESLRALNILDTLPEERFDRYTRLAKRLFGVPIALVSLVDANRQWFKSRQGLGPQETGRDISFCGHTILGPGPMVINNALEDERFIGNPLVHSDPNIRFYAGQPIHSAEGFAIGTLCLIDREPRTLDQDDLDALADLALMVESEFRALHQASTDVLTGLSNRRGFEAISQHLIANYRRMGQPASVIFVDLDRFKQVNDVHGHEQGDQALVDTAEILLRTFRSSDAIGRLGGDEFAILCAHTGGVQGVVERLKSNFDAHNATSGRPYVLEYSFGVIPFEPERHFTICDLLREADVEMYDDKARRRVADAV